MTQLTQFTVFKGSDRLNVQPASLATYVAAGYAIAGVRYSEGGEGLDVVSLVLMQLGNDVIYVHPGAVATYEAAGYRSMEMIYGAAVARIPNQGGALAFMDVPAFSSAEVGAVAATKVAVTFSTEVTAADYAAGVTIKVNTVSKTISAATRQTDQKVVHYTIPAVTNGQTVTWEYAEDNGNITSAVDGSPLDSVTAQAVTNTVA
jgi:hypothetical protein